MGKRNDKEWLFGLARAMQKTSRQDMRQLPSSPTTATPLIPSSQLPPEGDSHGWPIARICLWWGILVACIVALVQGAGGLHLWSIVLWAVLGAGAGTTAIFEHGLRKKPLYLKRWVFPALIALWFGMLFVGHTIWAEALEQERTDVYVKLRFYPPQTKGLDAIHTAFKVTNESDHEILAEPLLCGQSDSVIRFRNLVVIGGSSYADKPITKVGKGGDVQSTTCLLPLTHAFGMADYSVLCADIRVHLNYHLADAPNTPQTKVLRFLGMPTAADGFNWEELPANGQGSPCEPKPQ